MKKIYQASLLELLPESVLLDPKLRASAEALDAQFQAVTAATREVLHLPRLDELSGNIVDYLAEQFHIDFYEPLYLTEAEKKDLIRTSIAWHRIKGTPAAVEQIAHAAFRDAEILEWFEYGGEPYHFKIRSHGYKETPDGWATYLRLIGVAKNVRSWCDNLEVYWDETDIGKNQAFAGALELQTGAKEVLLSRPPDTYPTKIFAGNANLICGSKLESLRRPNSQLIIKNFCGQILSKVGAIEIDSSTKSTADDSLAYAWKAKLFAGLCDLIYGRKTWNLSLPREQSAKTFAGAANLIFGDKVESLHRPRLKFDESSFTAQVLTKIGAIKVDSSTKSSAEDSFAHAWTGNVYSGNANLKSGDLIIEPCLIKENSELLKFAVGQVLSRVGSVQIGKSNTSGENLFSKAWSGKFFAGTANGVIGRKYWSISPPKDEIENLHAGTANWIVGNKIESLSNPNLNFERSTAAGQILGKIGEIKIESTTRPTREDYVAHAWNSKTFADNVDLKTGDFTIKRLPPKVDRKIVVRVGLPNIRTGFITIGCAKDDDDWDFPDDGDWLRLWFAFPNYGTRTVTLANPREDLAHDDFSEVSDYAVNNGMLINRLGQETTGISKAALIIKRERKIF